MSAPPIVVLRPEPGAAATLARIAAAGGTGLAVPLFRIVPLAWTPPAPDAFDALLLTSANAVRHAGPALDALAGLPVHAVGAATADAARARGLAVVAVGATGVADLARAMADAGVRCALWLAGRDRTPLPPWAPVAATIAVYAADPVDPPPGALPPGATLLVHSRRAAARIAALVPPAARGGHALVATSAAVAGAAGPGWGAVTVAAAPTDAALVAAAIDRIVRDADKRAR